MSDQFGDVTDEQLEQALAARREAAAAAASVPPTAAVPPEAAAVEPVPVEAVPRPGENQAFSDAKALAEENARLRAQLLEENAKLREALAASRAEGSGYGAGLSDEDVRRLERPEEFAHEQLLAQLTDLRARAAAQGVTLEDQTAPDDAAVQSYREPDAAQV